MGSKMKKIYTYWMSHKDEEGSYYKDPSEALEALIERIKELDLYKDEESLQTGIQDGDWGINEAILYSDHDAEAPMQPIVMDGKTPRFKKNSIVSFLLEAGPFDLNTVWCLPNVSIEDMEQLYQLIGYSVGGFGEMSKFRKKTVKMADKKAAELLVAQDVEKCYSKKESNE
jgi:hypothetical protein